MVLIGGILLFSYYKRERNRELLFRAVTNNDIENVSNLLKKDPSLINLRDYEGSTPLSYVKSEEMTELLLNNGADINAADKLGRKPLHFLAIRGELRPIEYLISRGVDINEKDGCGHSPLSNALLFKRLETVDLLRKHGAKE